MNQLYEEPEKTVLWKILSAAIIDLEENLDIQLLTKNKYVVGYLCKKLSEQKGIKEE